MLIPFTKQCYLIGAFNFVNKTNRSVTSQNTMIGLDSSSTICEMVKNPSVIIEFMPD